MKNHYVLTVGLRGCLPNVCLICEDKESALDSAKSLISVWDIDQDLYDTAIQELTDYDFADLDLEVFGNEYVEIEECDCNQPCQHDESGDLDWCTHCHPHLLFGIVENATPSTVERITKFYNQVHKVDLDLLQDSAMIEHCQQTQPYLDVDPYIAVLTEIRDGEVLHIWGISGRYTGTGTSTIVYDESPCVLIYSAHLYHKQLTNRKQGK